MRHELTRVREQGTSVTNTGQSADPGIARINALRDIVQSKQYAKIDGIMVDLFSASIVLNVYDALNDSNQAKLRACPIPKMVSISMDLLANN
ncbi:MAG: hypothetical protein KC587_12050 [Nitrospira sp.]|nr:hypothetical protein [Nitrospira sp.]